MRYIATGGHKRCAGTRKDGKPCSMPAVTGKTLCGGHDPETRAKAQAAGHAAGSRTPGYLKHDAAVAAVDFKTRPTIKATLERVARHVVAGELEARAVNATILAANGALAVINDEERSAKRRATDMTDEELDAAIDEEIAERIRRRETIGVEATS